VGENVGEDANEGAGERVRMGVRGRGWARYGTFLRLGAIRASAAASSCLLVMIRRFPGNWALVYKSRIESTVG
jgi:hypothetical protein